jgi:two-component sensor histidine kinase
VVALLASELVTNALRHARPPIEITIDCDGRGTRVTVTDGHPGRPVLRPHSEDGEGGRGLQIVDALAAAWGVQGRPGGKAVWFFVDHDGSARGLTRA